MTAPEPLNPRLITTSAHVTREVYEDTFLRQLFVDVEYGSDTDTIRIGHVTGWIGWDVDGEDVHDAADTIGADAELLGATVAGIMDARPDLFIESVLLVDRMYLEPAYRGSRLAGAIVSDLLGLFRLDIDTTMTVLCPEPQRPGGGPLASGPERDAALGRLCGAYRQDGFEPWASSTVWWLPID